MSDTAGGEREPRDRWASARPVAILLLALMACLALPTNPTRLGEAVVALVATAALVALYLSLKARSAPRWLVVLPVLGGFVTFALIRDATGGSASGLSPLIAAPAFCIALTGTRRELRIATLLTGLTFVVPELVIGGARYNSEEWRRALIWMAVVGVAGPLVQQLVTRLQLETSQARRAEEQRRMVMDAAELTAIIVTDVRGSITSFGVGAERLLGLHAGAVVGRPMTELHRQGEIEAAAAALGVEPDFAVLAALAKSRAASRTWTWTHSDGAAVTVRSVVTELRDQGDLVGYLVMGTDVTESVRARRALQEAGERWQVVMDHLPDATLILVDPQRAVSLVSGAGAMREKLEHGVGRLLAEVVSPENVDIFDDLISRAFLGESGRADLNSARTGHEHEVLVVPLPHLFGPSDALILARDVSRDRERERALRQATHRAERMFADAPVAILTHDTEGVVLSANPAALRLFETTDEWLIGVELGEVSVLPANRGLREQLARLRTAGAETATGQWQVRLPGGRELCLGLSSRLLHDDPDHPDLVLTHVVDLTEQQRHEQQLVHLADHDPLTGLANRRRFDAELSRHLDSSRRYGAEGALLMIDIDHFKQVNDTLGHAAGDQVIVAVADLLTRDLRSSDIVARLGGDEFVVLLPRVSRHAAEVVARSVVRSVRDTMRQRDGVLGAVTVSVGVLMVADTDFTMAQVLSMADLALYDAKQRGRDSYVVYEPQVPAAAALDVTPVVQVVPHAG